ncbi:MAG: aromatic ring-hydroxylating dioxygenase subunit alpha [Gammaproteobacteria bacterium]|jgi:carnitine monooxygenase subunit|nr:aromatic ring-hydroxylating dioxygenase subunit alpha [Gammaproteobacteria bacterium]
MGINSQLQEMARREVENFRHNRIDLADEVLAVPTADYVDQARWQKEIDLVFKRVPLALGFSSEFSAPGDYKALKVAGVPVIIVRTQDGSIAAHVNMCSHRGNYVVAEGSGHTTRFRCNYHAWNYALEGDLISILDEENFGSVDKSCHGLTALPAAERAGLVWVTLNPDSKVDIDDFLSGYEAMLTQLRFNETQVAGTQRLDGPNWKVAYDGYRDFYHLPVLHKETIGAGLSHQPDYYAWGPHVRVVSPNNFADLANTPEADWADTQITQGVWTIFPNISIAGGANRDGMYMVSQLYPGESPMTSTTQQNFLHFGDVKDVDQEALDGFMSLMHTVVAQEDYATGFNVQSALSTGAKAFSYFGRNEGGGQLFHRWVDAILAASDDELPALFANGI